MKFTSLKKTPPGMIGIEISDQGISFAHVEESQGKQQLRTCEMLINSDGQLPQAQFCERIQQLQLKGMRCNVVLPAGSYSLLLVEAPNVPEEELRDAVRFRVKDMIAFPLDEALIDVFSLPADSSRSGRKMIYVVAIQESKVRDIMALISAAELELTYVDIFELALRNITEKLDVGQRGVAMVRLLQGQATLALVREGNMYLSRQFDLPYNAGLFDDLPEDQLVLELQRSLDYYERQMGQVPPAHIFLCGDNVSADKVTDNLSSSVAGDVSVLALSESLNAPDSLDESLLQLCVSAIGGALRQGRAA
ncbi:MAG: pilus assembly protein PilM [Cellvibrionaceae bacterium]